MKNLISLSLAFSVLAAVSAFPIQASAQSFNLIVCGEDENDNKKIDKEEQCTYASLIELVQNLMTAMVVISTFLATATFAYAGVKLLASGGNESAMTDAKKMFTKVLIGYLWILGAWVVVYTITSILLKPNEGYTILEAPKPRNQ